MDTNKAGAQQALQDFRTLRAEQVGKILGVRLL